MVGAFEPEPGLAGFTPSGIGVPMASEVHDQGKENRTIQISQALLRELPMKALGDVR